MTNAQNEKSFEKLVDQIGDIGFDYHAKSVIENARYNARAAGESSLKSMPKPEGAKARSAVVISAGPSVRSTKSISRIKAADYQGSIIATDGSYVACIREGLIPDYVVSLDPHPTRIVRWFGDPNIEKNSENDDYFERQDLNIDFRKNALAKNLENIDLVNQHASKTAAVLATTVHQTVSDRVSEAGFPTYWWNPLVDNPAEPESLTAKLYDIVKVPCLNTGGTVGTAAWMLGVLTLGIPDVAVVGMDFGYPASTPYDKTQTYHELIAHRGSAEGIEEYFVKYRFDLTGEEFYTDPTYFWYRRNFLDLERKVSAKTYNCTEGGTLVDPGVECVYLDDFLSKF